MTEASLGFLSVLSSMSLFVTATFATYPMVNFQGRFSGKTWVNDTPEETIILGTKDKEYFTSGAQPWKSILDSLGGEIDHHRSKYGNELLLEFWRIKRAVKVSTEATKAVRVPFN
ncbi:hypothetical protein IW261DRAFT_1421156 [Armillaria novae-zelandiae]|uniref:Uncharacterized protein n=1 Tax=Armillaria novae-zelandiae TaxID=153914 RepID=A0AA39U8Y3_9AGAR|nr:hypothetical protein IW261DRAFT_1421156 [Armillaria novae-zelandiae]